MVDELNNELGLKRRGLYNSLRMNWLRDPSLDVEAWQVEDYRALSEEELFGRLEQLDIHLDRSSFLVYAEESDGPEELADTLTEEDEDQDARLGDQVYLLIFELWRRLAHDQPCLSIFCDELDHQIDLYDRDEVTDMEALQDTLSAFEAVLDENADQGVDPDEIFATIASECAHDIESFLYDYAAEQLDEDNAQYASELVDAFYEYVPDTRWFDFLKVRLAVLNDEEEAGEILAELIAEADDLDFCLELLAFLVEEGQNEQFSQLLAATIPLLESEEDLQDLLGLCRDYHQRRDQEQQEQEVVALLESRKGIKPESELDPHDAVFAKLTGLV